jgi:bifunctional UDP-N-acetylglucosamine pyrophosphorylase / glucosamine-1-phosphate N-acetyltransferase
MSETATAAIILAAGMGTRMKSDLHKVLHPIGGKPMLAHLQASLETLNVARSVIVVGARREQVARHAGSAQLVVQEPQLGTGHAVLMAREAMAGFTGKVLILYGDVPLVRADTMQALLDALDGKTAIAVLGFRPADPAAYGRILLSEDGSIAKMVEFKDATPQERAVTLCNSGMMAVQAELLFGLLDRVTNANAAGEYYLPDIVGLAIADGRRVALVETDEGDVAGVNSRADLAAAELRFQQQRRAAAMDAGATLIDPATVWFSHDTRLGRDVLIEPNVFFGPGVDVADGVTIRANSHIEGASIGPGAEIGPFARLRPGAQLGEKVKIGNFVEVKKTVMEAGAKANHLTYLGDAHVGAGANVGAGTITCNYDGYFKHNTVIGAGAFIGSNSALVAPVTIGAGAIVGAGSVITRDVAADALAVARGDHQEKPGWAARFRAAMAAKKAQGKPA